MSSLRTRTLADGTLTFTVLYRLDSRQTSTTFDTARAAERFREDGARLGWQAAREIADARKTEGREAGEVRCVDLAEDDVDYLIGILTRIKKRSFRPE